MAPIKFDENIKEKFEKRVLTPSPEAWDRLSNRLEKEEKGSNGKLFLWLGIAASIVGVILFSTLIFDTDEIGQLPTVVETEKTNDVDSDGVDNETPYQDVFELTKENLNETVVVQNETKSSAKNEASMESPKKSEEKNTVTNQTFESVPKNAVATTDGTQKTIENSSSISQLDAETIKVNEVVAEIRAMKESGYQVTNRELDSLLKQAERELLKDKLYNETTKTVDANTLLQDVEDDLEQTFRAKVFDALVNGYDSVRTAVANRNN